jgi:hypothetical protein
LTGLADPLDKHVQGTVRSKHPHEASMPCAPLRAPVFPERFF